MSIVRVLTGITTTGTPHLGNYVGAIRPAIEASKDVSTEAYLFLADFHALIKNQDPDQVAQSSREIAATWLALGLDPEKTFFYRQSDVPEISELSWILSCSAAKGLMNRAHAYKAAVQANEAAGEDPDFAVTMGLFSYPILMAADILIFNAHKVPVGRDQIQHVEMARDIAKEAPARGRLGLRPLSPASYRRRAVGWARKLIDAEGMSLEGAHEHIAEIRTRRPADAVRGVPEAGDGSEEHLIVVGDAHDEVGVDGVIRERRADPFEPHGKGGDRQ